MLKTGGIIYAIGAAGTSLVKIGSTRADVARRLRTLQTGQPFVLSVLATAPVEDNVRTTETAVHRFLADKRQRGEWFAIDALDDAGLAQLIVEAIRYLADEEARQSSRHPSAVPCIDLAALGERLQRWRQWRGYSRQALSRFAGVDPMVVSRLESRQKPRLEVETAAKLARVCGWTLDQLCGLAPVPTLPVPTPGYTPCPEGMPAWLAGGLPTSTEDRHLAAHILAWQMRGATMAAIAETLTAWGVEPFERGKPWNAERVEMCVHRHTFGTKKAQDALLRKHGFRAEAIQLAARRA